MSTPVRQKDPTQVASGLRGARKRWGPQRIVRLDELDPLTAEHIRVMVANDKAAKERAKEAAAEEQAPDAPESAA